MKIILDTQNKSVIRLDRDDDVLEVFKSLATEKDQSFTFSMIGAAKMAELGYYNLAEKRNFGRIFESGAIEILSCSGSVAWYGDEAVVHAHGVFSNEKCECFGGHVIRLVISLTGEVVIDWLPEKINKKYDEETGLKLLYK